MTSGANSDSPSSGSGTLEIPRGPVTEFRQALREDPAVAALEFLAEHPEFAGNRSFVIDLAYEEYCHRAEAGEKIDPQEFCGQFPECQHSLRKLLNVHRVIGDLGRTAPIEWPQAGDEILGYLVRDELGRGAFSRVYLAEELALGHRLVAIKIAGADVGQEADALGRLNHPNIVPVHSVRHDVETQLSLVCMPFLGGATLLDVIVLARSSPELPLRAQLLSDVAQGLHLDTPVDPARASRPRFRGTFVDGVISIGQQLARALAAAHLEGILHLDVKPSNVLLGRDDRPMLLDFNLSQSRASHNSRVGGTIPYMSPEQLLGLIERQPFESKPGAHDTPCAVDCRADVFSLGVTLYELLTGQLPFGPVPTASERSDVARALRGLQAKGPISLRKLHPGVDPAFAAVLERCLAFDPRQRPQSAAALAEQLGKCLAPERRLERWIRPRRVALALGAAGCLAILSAVAAYVSTLEPYEVRAVDSGNAALHRGEYSSAHRSFDSALQVKPGYVGALFGKARVYFAQGQYLAAIGELKRLPDSFRNSNPQSWALEADCYTRLEDFDAAVGTYKRAVEQGFATPEVWNNLGYNYLQSSNLKEAEGALDKAIVATTKLQAPFYNRSIVRFNRSGGKSSSAHLAGAIEDIEQALRQGLPSGEMYLHAATLYAVRAQENASPDPQARDHLLQAVRFGVNVDVLRGHPVLGYLLEDGDVLDLRGREFDSGDSSRTQILNVMNSPNAAPAIGRLSSRPATSRR